MVDFLRRRIMCPYIHIHKLTLPTYGLCIAIAAVVMVVYAMKQAKKRNVLTEDVLIVSAMCAAFALIGAKVMYIFVTYSMAELIELVKKGDFSFMGGSGLVFLGGLLFAIVGAWVGSLVAKQKLVVFEDLIIPIVPVGHAIGRIGCLLAGCCYGKVYDGLFAIHYRNISTGEWSTKGYFPVQPLEALLNCVIAVVLYRKSKKEHKEYFLLLDYLLYYAIMRFGLEFLRGDAERGVYGGISTSQWICMALVLVNVLIRVVAMKKKK